MSNEGFYGEYMTNRLCNLAEGYFWVHMMPEVTCPFCGRRMEGLFTHAPEHIDFGYHCLCEEFSKHKYLLNRLIDARKRHGEEKNTPTIQELDAMGILEDVIKSLAEEIDNA